MLWDAELPDPKLVGRWIAPGVGTAVNLCQNEHQDEIKWVGTKKRKKRDETKQNITLNKTEDKD